VSDIDVIRAWKDEVYRTRLEDVLQFEVEENPAGYIELEDADLESVLGGTTSVPCLTVGLSALVSCFESIAHGTCGGWSIGCCEDPPPV